MMSSPRHPRRTKPPYAGECRFWAPKYRGQILALLGLVLVGIALTYATMELMVRLVKSLEGSYTGPLTLPVLVAGFSAATLAKVGIDYLQIRRRDRMNADAMISLEREVLEALFRQDAAFFSRHALQEIVSRLIRDVIRVIDRRAQVIVIVACVAELLVVLAFFLTKEWSFALVMTGCCIASVLWVMRTTRRFTSINEHLFDLDEKNSILLEQYLRATPEMQLARATERAQESFGDLRQRRFETLLRRGKLKASRLSTCPLIEGLTLTGVFLVALLAPEAGIVALLPVLIQKIPTVFARTGELTEAMGRIQLARAGIKRLEAYHSDEWNLADHPAFPTVAEVGELRLEGVTKRYEDASGRLQGGVADVTCTIPPGTLCVIAGGSGSGKSTLVNVILGALRPQQGRIRVGETDWLGAEPEERARRLAYLPQRPVLVQGTIERNALLVARERTVPELDTPRADRVERCGLATICRQKALELPPSREAFPEEIIAEAHRDLARRVHGENAAAPAIDPTTWATPLGKWRRTDPFDPDASKRLAGDLLESTRRLLELPGLTDYLELAPAPITESEWKLRRRAHQAEDDALHEEIAATLRPAEVAQLLAAGPGDTLKFLAETLGLQPPPPKAWHEQESWRDALLAALPPPDKVQDRRRHAEALLETIAAVPALRDGLLDLGLDCEVGVSGSALSGGQAQIVGLARALLRDAGLIVLDEPSSALDPVRARQVRDCLREVRDGRIILVVTHDATLVTGADHVLLLDRGALVAQGSPQSLAQTSQLFRQLYPEVT